jgi:hypothetical protein
VTSRAAHGVRLGGQHTHPLSQGRTLDGGRRAAGLSHYKHRGQGAADGSRTRSQGHELQAAADRVRDVQACEFLRPRGLHRAARVLPHALPNVPRSCLSRRAPEATHRGLARQVLKYLGDAPSCNTTSAEVVTLMQRLSNFAPLVRCSFVAPDLALLAPLGREVFPC